MSNGIHFYLCYLEFVLFLITNKKYFSQFIYYLHFYVFQVELGPTSTICNIKYGITSHAETDGIINNDTFSEFWLSWFNCALRLGSVGNNTPILELEYIDEDFPDGIGYIKFNSPNTKFNQKIWMLEGLSWYIMCIL